MTKGAPPAALSHTRSCRNARNHRRFRRSPTKLIPHLRAALTFSRMFLLLALLSRLAPLLPQSLRAFAGRQLLRCIEHRITRASPRDAAYLLRLCEALIDTAQTREEIITAISFSCRTQATLADLDRSGHFNRHKPRRMRFTRRAERARAIHPAPDPTPPRALDLSG